MNMNDTMNRVIMAMIVIILITGAYYAGKVKGAASNSDDISLTLSEDGTQLEDSLSIEGEEISMEDASEDAGGATPTVTMEGGSVTVVDQSAGSVVKVSSATLPQVGWIAVRDAKGWVLGARRFEAGTNSDVEVMLLRDTIAGGTYQVLLYSDDGDGQYDLHKDSLVMNPDASVAGTTFTAQ